MLGKKGLAILMLTAAGLILVSVAAAAQPVTVDQMLAALGEGPTLGAPDAPVTIIEFSDFQCSFCKKFWQGTIPRLKETYVKPGRVRIVYRHLAILGEHSVQAALAAECAGEQRKFWDYHDQLFGAQGPLPYTRAKLLGYASGLNLDGDAFSQCLESGKYAKKVERETRAGQLLGARGTPTFFMNGQLLIGAHPFETFQAIIQELEKAPVPGSAEPSQKRGQGR
ncbi:MAG: DsbA family protein [Nitrospinae bacterium]|nr:DsbA family protein [Nitrospinota bacterium]